MVPRLFVAGLGLLALRALRVRLSVGPRRLWWEEHRADGELVLVALGDSLTQGIGASRPDRTWLSAYVAEVSRRRGVRVRVVNRAVYGAKVADVLTDQLPLPVAADLVTLCVGSNDAGRTEPQVFREQLRQVCAQLPAGAVVGDIPEFRWGPRVPRAAELARVVREVVAEYPGLLLAPVERETTGLSTWTDLAGDFFHPNDRGYTRIGDAFLSTLG